MKQYENFITDLFKSKDIFKLIEKEDIKGIKKYIESGSDLEVEEKYSKRTPLLVCAHAGSPIKMTEMLFSAGADPYKTDKNGKNFFDMLDGFSTELKNDTIVISYKWWFFVYYPIECKKEILELDLIEQSGYTFSYTFIEISERAGKLKEFRGLFPEKYAEYLKTLKRKEFNL